MAVVAAVRAYDDRGPTYVPVYMREMVAANQCAPSVYQQMESWLVYVSDLHHYRFLITVAVDKLITQLDAGSDVCLALRPVLQRVQNAHRNVVNQRAALEMYAVEGDGWAETAAHLKTRLKDVEALCRLQPSQTPHRATLLSCLRRVQKQAKKKMLVHHLP